jgi:hypothetical protein
MRGERSAANTTTDIRSDKFFSLAGSGKWASIH